MSNKVITALLLAVLLVLVTAVITVKLSETGARSSSGNKLIIFHAGSLSVPFKEISEQFEELHPEISIIREAAGSRAAARKISDLNRKCDVMASSDYKVIQNLLIPDFAEWYINFVGNEIVIAFMKETPISEKISKNDWYNILTQKEVRFGRSDPNTDPCGYRSVLLIQLAETFYNKTGLAKRLLQKNRNYIRPKEVDLLSLLEVGELDCIFIYRSVAMQHNLEFIKLPDEINLGNPEFKDFYKKASMQITGKKPGTSITKVGEPITYALTITKSAANRKLAVEFLTFVLKAEKGGAILQRNGHRLLVPRPTATFAKLPDALTIFALPPGKGIKE